MNLKKVNIRTAATSFLHSTILCAFLLLSAVSFGQDVANGEKKFKQNCTACHSAGEKFVAAPGLAGVAERWAGNEDMLYQWIQDPTKALATGDKYVKSLLGEYETKYGRMAAQAVSKEEIDDILAYIAAYVPPAPKVVEVADTATAGDTGSSEISVYWWGFIALLFFVLVWILSGVKTQLDIAAHEQEGKVYEAVGMSTSIKRWVVGHRTLTGIIVLFLMTFMTVKAWNAAATIGIYEGYMPEQPIAYSHKLHAGDLEIDCQYCHSMAEKSKTPMIPSANVCMNCHKQVQEGPTGETEEIAKIYAAIGWDKETYTYSGETEPIRWIKVHDLPDHVYFNHSQHVKVGQIACQECHGPIEEMEVVRQEKPLTMEWCISCHNQTEVQMDGNGYYDEISARLRDNELGEELLKQYLEDEKITVRELGGWECSKCHY